MFETSDLYTAAYLLQQGHVLEDLRREAGRAVFAFQDSSALQAALRTFFVGPYHAYAERVRSVKAMAMNAPMGAAV